MRMSSPVEALISNELLPDEEVIWSGGPDPKGKGAVSSSRLIISGWIYTVFGLLFIISSFILSVGVLQGYTVPLVALIVVGLLAFFVGLLCLRIGYTARFSSQKRVYAITNRRVIILNKGRYLRVTSHNKRAITQIQRVERPNGFGDLTIAAGPYGNLSVNRHNTLMAIPDVRHVEQKLLAMLDEEPYSSVFTASAGHKIHSAKISEGDIT